MHAARLEPTEAPVSDFVRATIAYVLDRFADELCLDDLAGAAGLSRFNFSRRFQKETGTTPMRWLWTFRTLLAAELIALDPEWSLTDVAFSSGFGSSAHFSRSFRQVFGMPPSAYRKACHPRDGRAGASFVSFDALYAQDGAMVERVATRALSHGR